MEDLQALSEAINALKEPLVHKFDVEGVEGTLETIASTLLNQGYADEYKGEAASLLEVVNKIESMKTREGYRSFRNEIASLGDLSSIIDYDNYLTESEVEEAEESREVVFAFLKEWLDDEQ